MSLLGKRGSEDVEVSNDEFISWNNMPNINSKKGYCDIFTSTNQQQSQSQTQNSFSVSGSDNSDNSHFIFIQNETSEIPSYLGAMIKRSKFISGINPLIEDSSIDYDVDSSDEMDIEEDSFDLIQRLRDDEVQEQIREKERQKDNGQDVEDIDEEGADEQDQQDDKKEEEELDIESEKEDEEGILMNNDMNKDIEIDIDQNENENEKKKEEKQDNINTKIHDQLFHELQIPLFDKYFNDKIINEDSTNTIKQVFYIYQQSSGIDANQIQDQEELNEGEMDININKVKRKRENIISDTIPEEEEDGKGNKRRRINVDEEDYMNINMNKQQDQEQQQLNQMIKIDQSMKGLYLFYDDEDQSEEQINERRIETEIEQIKLELDQKTQNDQKQMEQLKDNEIEKEQLKIIEKDKTQEPVLVKMFKQRQDKIKQSEKEQLEKQIKEQKNQKLNDLILDLERIRRKREEDELQLKQLIEEEEDQQFIDWNMNTLHNLLQSSSSNISQQQQLEKDSDQSTQVQSPSQAQRYSEDVLSEEGAIQALSLIRRWDFDSGNSHQMDLVGQSSSSQYQSPSQYSPQQTSTSSLSIQLTGCLHLHQLNGNANTQLCFLGLCTRFNPEKKVIQIESNSQMQKELENEERNVNQETIELKIESDITCEVLQMGKQLSAYAIIPIPYVERLKRKKINELKKLEENRIRQRKEMLKDQIMKKLNQENIVTDDMTTISNIEKLNQQQDSKSLISQSSSFTNTLSIPQNISYTPRTKQMLYPSLKSQSSSSQSPVVLSSQTSIQGLDNSSLNQQPPNQMNNLSPKSKQSVISGDMWRDQLIQNKNVVQLSSLSSNDLSRLRMQTLQLVRAVDAVTELKWKMDGIIEHDEKEKQLSSSSSKEINVLNPDTIHDLLNLVPLHDHNNPPPPYCHTLFLHPLTISYSNSPFQSTLSQQNQSNTINNLAQNINVEDIELNTEKDQKEKENNNIDSSESIKSRLILTHTPFVLSSLLEASTSAESGQQWNWNVPQQQSYSLRKGKLNVSSDNYSVTSSGSGQKKIKIQRAISISDSNDEMGQQEKEQRKMEKSVERAQRVSRRSGSKLDKFNSTSQPDDNFNMDTNK
ncbi:MAG: hypothetical protein EZS28_000463 [Streblomastix strix]|uniref:Uncharacterized protein n=1 Tax=Streblomastix strix TaxID=222440 RepID=A0A5J4XA78_9EUKA|nr:MAG: hypothetical protein EZS28_000463 [Streblomastix strix]